MANPELGSQEDASAQPLLEFDGVTLVLTVWPSDMPEFPSPWIRLDLGAGLRWQGQATAPPTMQEDGRARWEIRMDWWPGSDAEWEVANPHG